MDVHRFLGNAEKGTFSGKTKCSISAKDVKKKLSCINKRINDLHHQRKFVYKNSIKVKRMVHNQINQIVRSFRVRERNINIDVDEVYFSHDAKISDELSRLQSISAHCQALFNHIGDFKEKSDVLKNIDIILSEVNIDEKPDVKPLEFLSDFETMKLKANSYGYLEGDFVKKDDFVCVEEKLFHDNCKLSHNKEYLNQNCFAANDSFVSGQKRLLYKATDSDDFQIIDLLDNMSCQDMEDISVMGEDCKLNCTLEIENKLNEVSSNKSEGTFRTKDYNSLKSSPESCDANIGFNLEEEWKQILNMNKGTASWHEVTSKETANDPEGKGKSFYKNCNTCNFLFLKEANKWLHNSKYDKLEKEGTFEKTKNEINSTSPAEILKKSFKSYLVKDNIQNWLSAY